MILIIAISLNTLLGQNQQKEKREVYTIELRDQNESLITPYNQLYELTFYVEILEKEESPKIVQYPEAKIKFNTLKEPIYIDVIQKGDTSNLHDYFKKLSLHRKAYSQLLYKKRQKYGYKKNYKPIFNTDNKSTKKRKNTNYKLLKYKYGQFNVVSKLDTFGFDMMSSLDTSVLYNYLEKYVVKQDYKELHQVMFDITQHLFYDFNEKDSEDELPKIALSHKFFRFTTDYQCIRAIEITRYSPQSYFKSEAKKEVMLIDFLPKNKRKYFTTQCCNGSNYMRIKFQEGIFQIINVPKRKKDKAPLQMKVEFEGLPINILPYMDKCSNPNSCVELFFNGSYVPLIATDVTPQIWRKD